MLQFYVKMRRLEESEIFIILHYVLYILLILKVKNDEKCVENNIYEN